VFLQDALCVPNKKEEGLKMFNKKEIMKKKVLSVVKKYNGLCHNGIIANNLNYNFDTVKRVCSELINENKISYKPIYEDGPYSYFVV
jgi:predicted transcriptional regulator